MKEERKLLKKADLVLICILLVVALSSYLIYNSVFSSKEVYAQIIYNNEVIKTVSLSENLEFSVEQAPEVIFEIKDNRIHFKYSDCPDKVCVNTGYISSAGQLAVCLPNKLSLKIVPYDKTDEIDIVI